MPMNYPSGFKESAIERAQEIGVKKAAAELKMPAPTLYKWRQDAREGLPRRRQNAEDLKAQAIEHAREFGCDQAAKEFGVALDTLRNWHRAATRASLKQEFPRPQQSLGYPYASYSPGQKLRWLHELLSGLAYWSRRLDEETAKLHSGPRISSSWPLVYDERFYYEFNLIDFLVKEDVPVFESTTDDLRKLHDLLCSKAEWLRRQAHEYESLTDMIIGDHADIVDLVTCMLDKSDKLFDWSAEAGCKKESGVTDPAGTIGAGESIAPI